MRAIIVGAGASGVLHALALRAAGVAIDAVYDPDRTRATALAEAVGGRVVDSLASAASADAAVVAVCSPPRCHVAQAEALASGGRVVFVEKPVATSRLELQRLGSLRGCVPIVQWRAGRALRALRRAVQLGALGDAPSVACDLSWGRDDDYFRARRGWGCGALLSVGIHAIDAIAWALGRSIESTAAVVTRSRREAEGETAAAVVLRFAGGAMASLRLSLDGGADVTRITVCGEGTSVCLSGGEADPTASVLAWSARDERVRRRLEVLERDTPGALGPPLLVPYVGAAIAAVRDGERPGDGSRLPSIADVAPAHAAAIAASGVASSTDQAAPPTAPSDRPPFRCATSACAAASRAIVTRNGEQET